MFAGSVHENSNAYNAYVDKITNGSLHIQYIYDSST